MAKKNLTYSAAMEEIEEILSKMENEEVDIDNLSIQVKRVNELIIYCKDKLTKTEEEVDKIFNELNK